MYVVLGPSLSVGYQLTHLSKRGILALIVINKAGGLIYNRMFGDTLHQLNTKDYLVLAGTFHG
jgi:hypothetical protein